MFTHGKLRLTLIYFLQLTYSCLAQAHPYYAVNMGYNRCTACHVSPVGGGIRHLNGKFYGYRELKPSHWGQQDLIAADVRALYYYPEKAASTKSGSGVMAINLAANIPLSQESDATDTRFVIEHNLGGFPAAQGGPRDTYVRWQFYKDTEYHFYPQYILAGRYRSPFGLQNDEHRTYTKIQTKNTWNDFDMGAMITGDGGTFLHYDLAVANGAKSGGGGVGNGVATLWGGTANIRVAPAPLPLIIGASISYYEAAEAKNSPKAFALYSALSVGRLTGQYVPVTVLAEYVKGENWNPTINGFFTIATYQDSVATAQSEAWWGQLNYDLSDYFALLYKYDVFTPDIEFPADYYERHGVGFRYRQTAHLSLLARTEWAQATHPSESAGTAVGAQNASWLVLMMNL